MYQFRWLTVSGSSESGLFSLPAKISVFFRSQAALRSWTLRLSFEWSSFAPTPWSRGTRFGTCVHGWKLPAGGVPLTKAVLIGDATRSNWFIGVKPRICSIVRLMLTCLWYGWAVGP